MLAVNVMLVALFVQLGSSLVWNSRVWPSGTYGLVRPTTGCPHDFVSTWYTGGRHHDTEDSRSSNRWSSSFSLSGYKGSNNMRWEFCIKVRDGHFLNHRWPAGTYCILKKGSCPSGFHYGSVFWDDEDSRNANRADGTLPDGDYGRNTRIDFCCRKDGSTARDIFLPTRTPFILVAASSLCQNVYGMHVSHQWFHWDNEDSRNIDSTSGMAPYEDGGARNHRLHFCYYTRKQAG